MVGRSRRRRNGSRSTRRRSGRGVIGSLPKAMSACRPVVASASVTEPNPSVRRRVLHLRRKHRWGARGGWRAHGRGTDAGRSHRRAGYRYLHTALDDRSRIVYSETLDDEQGPTAAGFWRRATAWVATLGITCERVITDNGSCNRSREWHAACAQTNTTVKKTRPFRPQTNGKVCEHRALPPDLARGMGLHPTMAIRNPTSRRLRWLRPLLQSPPIPRRTRMANTHQHRQGQPPRRAQLVSTDSGCRVARNRGHASL